MSTDSKVHREVDLMHDANQPIGVGFTQDAVDVWHGEKLIATFPELETLMVKISHKGDLVAVITPFLLRVYDVKTNVLKWESRITPMACGESGHNLEFSGDDLQLLMTGKILKRETVNDVAVYSFCEKTIQCDIFNAIDGEEIVIASYRDSSKMANKFSFHLDSLMLTCGVDIGDLEDEDDDKIVMDFGIVNLKNTDDQDMEDGFFVRRFQESRFDPNGFVIRLIARQVDSETIFVLCVKSNGATIYLYNTNTWIGSAVGSLYIDTADGEVVNAGISADLSLIGILIQANPLETTMAFYDATKMKDRFRQNIYDDDAIVNFNDRINAFNLIGFDNIWVNGLIDKEIFVSSSDRNATIYNITCITTVYIDERKAFKKVPTRVCVSFSEPMNFITERLRSMALCMGLHKRLGGASTVQWLDPEMVRILHEMECLGTWGRE